MRFSCEDGGAEDDDLWGILRHALTQGDDYGLQLVALLEVVRTHPYQNQYWYTAVYDSDGDE